MAGITATDLLPVLKEIYPDGAPKEMIYKNAPFLGMLPKDTEEAYGEHIKVPLLYADPQGTSANFSNAGTNTTSNKWVAFELDTIDYYGRHTIDGRAIDKSKKDRGSFVRGLKAAMDGIMRSVKRRLSHNLYRNHGGALGQIATGGIASDVVTLTSSRDTRFFEPGMVLVGDTTDGTSGAVHAGTVTVESVQRNSGTVTATADWTAGIATLAAADYLFKQGDFGAMMDGLESWVPASDPSSTAFNGVDRSVDPLRLGGIRDDLSDRPIEEAVQDALQLCSDEGAETDVIMLCSADWNKLAKALGSKKEYGKRSAYDAEVGYKSIMVAGPSGDVDVISDPDAPEGVMWALQMDTWKLYSMGDLVRVLDDDGLPYLRQADADGVEIRIVSRPQLGCNAPGHNGRFTI